MQRWSERRTAVRATFEVTSTLHSERRALSLILFSNAGIVLLLAVTLIALPARADGLQKLGQEMSYFHVEPSKVRFDHLQSESDRLAISLQSKNSGDLLAAVELAAISCKNRWPINGRGKISQLAREILDGKSETASYVRDDSMVDVRKLDIWWAGFFGTGESKYLGKILQRAKYPQPGERAADFMMPAMAAWSFKSNCRQDKAVMSFAKQCLESNAFPTKKGFLKECIASADAHPATNR